VFRSKSRSVVYPQAEHARLSAAIAAAWGSDSVTRPALPFESFVRGVELHDRGYGMLDNDGLGEIPQERWLKIMRRGLEAQDEDAVVDLVVVMHIRRLVANTDATLGAELDAAYAARLEAAGVSEHDAAAADVVTDLCDRLSFSFCFEEAGGGTVGSFVYAVRSDGVAAVAPWPLGVPELTETVTGYRADGYPGRLDPVERVFALRQA
jgi:Protein of unknown function (DUF3891)